MAVTVAEYVKVFLWFIGYSRTLNANDGNRQQPDEVYVGNSKQRSNKWHLFSLADWIWTWQFANGWTLVFFD